MILKVLKYYLLLFPLNRVTINFNVLWTNKSLYIHYVNGLTYKERHIRIEVRKSCRRTSNFTCLHL